MIKDLIHELYTNEHSMTLFALGGMFFFIFDFFDAFTHYLWRKSDEILNKRKQEKEKKENE